MTQRVLLSVSAVALLAALGFSAVPPAAAQSAQPRTAWGDPDLQGFWTNTTTTPLERPADLAGREFLTDEEWAQRNPDSGISAFNAGPTGAYNDFWLEKGELSMRTSLIVDPPDGRLPAPTAAEAARREAERARFGDGGRPRESWVDFSTYNRCISRGMPSGMLPGFYNHNYHIVQTADHVVILVEMVHEARIIPLDGRGHLPAAFRQWMGDSVGRWEGDTLVVETVNLRHGHSEDGGVRVVERLTRTDADTIDYRITVHDPRLTAPWTALVPMTAMDGVLYEYACHEGNYSLANMLAGARADERAAAEGSR